MSAGGTEKLLLRVSEAAEALAVSRSHLYELIEAGKVPVVRLGGAVRVPKPWLMRLVEEETARWQRARAEE